MTDLEQAKKEEYIKILSRLTQANTQFLIDLEALMKWLRDARYSANAHVYERIEPARLDELTALAEFTKSRFMELDATLLPALSDEYMSNNLL